MDWEQLEYLLAEERPTTEPATPAVEVLQAAALRRRRELNQLEDPQLATAARDELARMSEYVRAEERIDLESALEQSVNALGGDPSSLLARAARERLIGFVLQSWLVRQRTPRRGRARTESER